MKFVLIAIALLMGILGVYAQTPQWNWAFSAGGPGQDQVCGMAIDSDGNQYVIGNFYGSIMFGNMNLPWVGSQDIFVAKLSPTGEVVWAATAGGLYTDSGSDIAVDNSGNVYVTGIYVDTASFGTSILTSSGLSDIFVAKLDIAGNWQWARTAGGNYTFEESPGEKSRGIALDTASNVYLTGFYTGQASFGNTILSSTYADIWATYASNMFIASLDSSGNWRWAVSSSGVGMQEGKAIVADENGDVYVLGNSLSDATFGTVMISNIGGYDIFVSKLDGAGNVEWVVSGGGLGNDIGADITLGPDNTLYITGSFKYSCDFGTLTLAEQSVYRNFAIRLDRNGIWLWAIPVGGLRTQNDDAFLAVDDSRNAYLTGVFWGSATFGATMLTSAGLYDIFVSKLNSTGDILWAIRAGGAQNDYGKCIAVDSLGKVRVAGFFLATADFGSITLVKNGIDDSDLFVATLSGGVPVSDELMPELENASCLYPAWPNPWSGSEALHMPARVAECETGVLSVYNLRGQIVLRQQLSAGKHDICLNMDGQAAGIYIYRLRTKNSDTVRRFVLLK